MAHIVPEILLPLFLVAEETHQNYSTATREFVVPVQQMYSVHVNLGLFYAVPVAKGHSILKFLDFISHLWNARI